MKNIVNLKTNLFLLISFIFLTNHAIGQDFKKIDNEFMSKNNIDSVESYINIYLNSNDCFRCFGEIQQILKTVDENNNDIQINIFTNQIVFAKKNTKEYPVNKNFFVNHEIFKEHPQSFYYYKHNGHIVNDIKQIIKEISKEDTISDINNLLAIKVNDDLFTSDELTHTGVSKNSLLIHDQSVDLGAIINIKNSNIDYYDINTLSHKLYQLPHPTYKDNFQLIDYDDFKNIKNNFPGVTQIKANSIKLFKNIVFTQFMVSKLFVSTQDSTTYELPSFTYLAVKNINNDSLSDIFDLDTYDYYFNLDILPYNSTDYRIGVSIYYPFKILNKYSFKAKIYQELDYAGEATFEINEDYTTLNITSINPEAPRIYEYDNIEIDGKKYYVDKEMTDESTGEGIISLKERVMQNNN